MNGGHLDSYRLLGPISLPAFFGVTLLRRGIPLTPSPLLFPTHSATFSLRTVSLLLDGLGLGNGEALHGLIFLLLRLVQLVLVVAVGVDQHPAVERVTVPPRTLAGPRDAVHCGGARRDGVYKLAEPPGNGT